MDNVCFLQLKAFGDFVIAAAAIDRLAVADRQRVKIAIGRHLRALCDAVAPAAAIVELPTTEPGVPALFDVRRHGAIAAVKSAWDLRRAIAGAPLPEDALILLDHIGPRERFAIGGRPAAAFDSGTTNIYAGYEKLLRDAGFTVRPMASLGRSQRRRVGVFPGSRVAAKNLSVELVADILRASERSGMEVELFLLDGERPDLEAGILPHTIVPRHFAALRDAVAGVDVVVSADSLPAHLAERAGAELYVFTPTPNPFWMPPSVVRENRCSLFDDPTAVWRLSESLAG